jgi:UDP-3-O-[3-hydroxymyristoyl] glucosamine N-acyltransferase
MSKENVNLIRISPEDFLQTPTDEYQYINLVINDMKLRETITDKLDNNNLDRFSFVHPSAAVDVDVGPTGLLIYPHVVVYPNVKINNDIIIHANTLIAHFSELGKGTYVSGSVTIGGNTKIGNYCSIGISATIVDKLTISPYVRIGPATLIRKNIISPGTYASPKTVKKLKNEN